MRFSRREERKILKEGMVNEFGTSCRSAEKRGFAGERTHLEEGVAEGPP
jgi:hypothetical protein